LYSSHANFDFTTSYLPEDSTLSEASQDIHRGKDSPRKIPSPLRVRKPISGAAEESALPNIPKQIGEKF
jgi:hypothetical protein